MLLGIAVAAATHIATVTVIPGAIMRVAVGRIAQRAGEANRLYQAPRPTPANQQVVRTSPDLAYATCALDLATGPVRVTVGGASSYASVAVYDGTTDNVFTLNDRQWPSDGITLVVARTGASVTVAPGERLVRLAGTRGVVLIRRLAPGDSAFARAERERAGDACAPVSGATR